MTYVDCKTLTLTDEEFSTVKRQCIKAININCDGAKCITVNLFRDRPIILNIELEVIHDYTKDYDNMCYDIKAKMARVNSCDIELTDYEDLDYYEMELDPRDLDYLNDEVSALDEVPIEYYQEHQW